MVAAKRVPYLARLKTEDPARLAEICRKGATCSARQSRPRKVKGAPKHLTNQQWEVQRKEAEKVAESVISQMEVEDALPSNSIARKAILSAITMLATDLTDRDRLAVIRTLLAFNISRPVTIKSVGLTCPEGWLDDLAAMETNR